MIHYYMQEPDTENWQSITPEKASDLVSQRYVHQHYGWVIKQLCEGRVIELRNDRKLRAIRTIAL